MKHNSSSSNAKENRRPESGLSLRRICRARPIVEYKHSSRIEISNMDLFISIWVYVCVCLCECWCESLKWRFKGKKEGNDCYKYNYFRVVKENPFTHESCLPFSFFSSCFFSLYCSFLYLIYTMPLDLYCIKKSFGFHRYVLQKLPDIYQNILDQGVELVATLNMHQKPSTSEWFKNILYWHYPLHTVGLPS